MANSDIQLLSHNEKAYEELIDSLEKYQMVGLNRATGTGKSFILLKYCYNVRHKRILYLAPTYPILYQLIEDHMSELGISLDDFDMFVDMIYRGLMKENMEELAEKFDVFILDEYHRCGALKWGKKVMELLNILKEKYPEKVVIGTTATEIRYLDSNRNMNNILFDGVSVAPLPLADAILEGILPASIYINYNDLVLTDIDKLENRVIRKLFYTCDVKKHIAEITRFKEEIDYVAKNTPNLSDYLRGCKKLLVFSSQIDMIENDKRFIEKHVDNIKHSYIVHSAQKKDINKKELDDFKNQNDDGISVLYSIDILNEGVHVKDIDAIVMMRKTTSPIIYFQQLGRLLSYSRRHDEVVVIDLVNNLSSNPVIYMLYRDVVDRAKELSLIYPEKKDHYQTIIDRFKIVDYTSEVYKTIDSFRETYSNEKVIEMRLNSAISILEGKIDTNEIEKFQAQIDILKYENYITLDLLHRIKDLDGITKPSIALMPEDEFINYLGGRKNIYEKDNKSTAKLFKELVSFYDTNFRLPTIFGESDEEIFLAKDLLNNYYSFRDKMRRFIKDNISDGLSQLEKLTYQGKMDSINLVVLKNEVKEAIKRGVDITNTMYDKLMLIELDSETKELIKDGFEKTNNKKSLGKSNYEESIYFKETFESVALQMQEEMKGCSFDEYVEKTFNIIYVYLKRNKRDVSYYNDDFTLSAKTKKYEQELYCKKLILKDEFDRRGYTSEINELLKTIKIEKLVSYQFSGLEGIFDFMETHQGALPSSDNWKDRQEVKLAERFSVFKSQLTKPVRERIKEIQARNSSRKDEIYDQYVHFLDNYGRKPSYTLESSDEKELFLEFNRWKNSFNEEEKDNINTMLSNINFGDRVNELLDFVKKHKGAFPTTRNKQHEDEVELAKFYISNKDRADALIKDDVESIRNKYKDEKDKVFYDYINFVRRNKRKPMVCNASEKEMELNSSMNRWFDTYSPMQLKTIEDTLGRINSYQNLKSAYYEIKSRKMK